jgi:hypothetical protein
MFFDAKNTTKTQLEREFTAMADAPIESCLMIPLPAYFRVMARSNTNEIIGDKTSAYLHYFSEVMKHGKLLWHYPNNRKPLGATIMKAATWHRTRTAWNGGNPSNITTRAMFSIHKACGFLRPRVQTRIWESVIINHIPSIQASLLGFAFFERDSKLADKRFVGSDAPLTGYNAFPVAVVSIPIYGLAAKTYVLQGEPGEGIGIGRARNTADLKRLLSFSKASIAKDLENCLIRAYRTIIEPKTNAFNVLQFCKARKSGGLTNPVLKGVREDRALIKEYMDRSNQELTQSDGYEESGWSSDNLAGRLFEGYDHLLEGDPALWRIGIKALDNGPGAFTLKSQIVDDPIMSGYQGLVHCL